MPLPWIVALIGLLGALVSGTFGIGGALVLIPLLLYVPPVLTDMTLSVQVISGLSILQVVAASLVGALVHGRRGNAAVGLVIRVGVPMQVAGVVGGAAAALMPGAWLLLVFAAAASLAAVLLLAPGVVDRPGARAETPGWLPAVTVGGGVGILAGLIGAGGSFLLLPLLIRVLRTPTRAAVGSSLAIALLGGTATLVGKLATGQVPFDLAPWALLGTIPGTLLGAQISHRLSTSMLRGLLALLVGGIAVSTWWTALTQLLGS